MAQRLGIDGSSAAMKMADSAKGWIIGATGKTAGLGLATLRQGPKGEWQAGVGPAGARPVKAGANALANLLNTRALRWIPGSKAAIAGLNVAASRSNEVGDYQKQYLSSLTEQQWNTVKKTTPVGPVAQASMLAEAVKRKDVGGLGQTLEKIPDTATVAEKAAIEERNKATSEKNDARLEQFVQASRKVNPGIADTKDMEKNIESVPNVKDALATNPRLASKLTGKSLTEIAEKMRPDKAADVEVTMYKEQKYVLGLSSTSISNVYDKGTTAQRNAIKETLENIIGPGLKMIHETAAKKLKEIADAKEIGAPKATIQALQATLAGFRTAEKSLLSTATTTDDQKKAYKKYKLAQKNIGDDE